MDIQTRCISSSLIFFLSRIVGIFFLSQLFQFTLLLAPFLATFKQSKTPSALFHTSHRPPGRLNIFPLAEQRGIVFRFGSEEGLIFHGFSGLHGRLLEACFVWGKELRKLWHTDRSHIFELYKSASERSCAPIFFLCTGTYSFFAKSMNLHAIIKQSGWLGRHSQSFQIFGIRDSSLEKVFRFAPAHLVATGIP